MVDALDALPADFSGIAVTRAGRAWLGAWRELHQIAEGGEERVLAERNRRDELIAESERGRCRPSSRSSAADRAAARRRVGAADAARDEAERALREAGARAPRPARASGARAG